MIDTSFERRMKKLSDEELNSRLEAAWTAAYLEAHGRDYEAAADAYQEFHLLRREYRRRKLAHGRALAEFLEAEA